MTASVADLLPRFADTRVLVIGDAMLDSYLCGDAGRLCREAPVPIVSVTDRRDAPGGAANAAANVRRLGGDVRLLGLIGEDHDARRLRAALSALGIDDGDLVVDPGRTTLSKQRIVADDHLLLRFDAGSTGRASPGVEARLGDAASRLHEWCEAILVSDYGYGVLTDGMIERLAKLQARKPRPIVVDAKRPERHRRLRPSAVKPNYAEAARLLGESAVGAPGLRAQQMAAQADRLLDACGAEMATVTLDSDGSVLLERERPAYRTYARPTSNARAAGAGDTFAACLTLALAVGADGPAAVELSSAAAAVAVGKDGTATCDADELETFVTGAPKHVIDAHDLARRLALARGQRQRVVFTNGCFDILHRGHVTYLSRAKALGDILVVGLNGDDSVRRLKGEGRPINPLEDRAQVLAALSCVDYIVPFDEDTPAELIRLLRPDVFAKGGDYTLDTLPEAPLVHELGGEVQLLPFTADRSTTRLIERIGSRRTRSVRARVASPT